MKSFFHQRPTGSLCRRVTNLFRQPGAFEAELGGLKGLYSLGGVLPYPPLKQEF